MATARDASGRFASKPREELSPAYRKRIERAEAKGKSRADARGHGTKPKPTHATATLTGNARYANALQVVSEVRRGTSLSKASREVGIGSDTVLRYAGSAFIRDQRGRWVTKPTDRLYRNLRWLDQRGLTVVEPANSREASKLSAYWSAVDHYLLTGDDRPLRRFRHMRLRTRQKVSLDFVTDPKQLERLGYAGQLSFEDLYEH